jgi:hypothetical protein
MLRVRTRRGWDRPNPHGKGTQMASAPTQPTSSQETTELLHRLAEKRSRLDSQRTEALRMMRSTASRLRKIDKQLDDIDAAETAVLVGGVQPS